MKIMIIITTGFVEYGGIANAFMNYYRNMNLENLIIDVVSCENHDKSFETIIEQNKGKCFDVPSKQKDLFAYIRAISKIINERYDVIDVHGNSATMFLELYIAKRKGIENRMAHCLNSKTSHPVIHNLLKPFFKRCCNNRTACTKEAGDFLYGKNGGYTILKNTIPTENYIFSEEKRKIIRNQYNIDEDIVLLGTVGKINEQKNQEFLLDVLKQLVNEDKNVKLMIVGDGPLRKLFELKVKEYGLENNVILTGMQREVIGYYSAFDIYLFPSLFEGESLALLEAKCSGIYGCASSCIKTKQYDGTDGVKYLDLKIDIWVDAVKEYVNRLPEQDRNRDSKGVINAFKKSGLDSKASAEDLRKLYFKFFRKRE